MTSYATDFEREFGVPDTRSPIRHINEEPSQMAEHDTFQTLVEPLADEHVPEPVDWLTDEAEIDSPRGRAIARLSNGKRYAVSEAQRASAQLWATLEQAAATDRQTAAIDRQTVVLERQAAALEEQNRLAGYAVAEARVQNQLLFFSIDPARFKTHRFEPEIAADGTEVPSLYEQVKDSLGIAG
ncbi:hypothetical protein ACFVAJ_18505 [Agromyces sp. NPDC057679]|uniref:hypothetical protein n=1 Tax=Agromyces sp. NPDC057679 TaxID=3346207 RepID=UPI00366D77C9